MALIRGGSIGLGTKAMAEDCGRQFGVDLKIGSSATKGVATRGGVGKIRHLQTPLLVLQRRMTNHENEFDIGTKLLGGDMLDRILKTLKFAFEARVRP